MQSRANRGQSRVKALDSSQRFLIPGATRRPLVLCDTVADMVKTTVYLPRQLKRALTQQATRRGISESELVREAVRAMTSETPPKPRLPLFASGRPELTERIDEALQGFGES